MKYKKKKIFCSKTTKTGAEKKHSDTLEDSAALMI